MIIENKSILVKGDVSGIQEFIFNVKSDKAAQELKGRSFFIKVLVEVAIQYLLDQFGIVDPNEIKDCKISTSGGNFILKLPTVADYETIIKKARQDFTKTLEFTGLNLSIASVEQTGDYKKDIHRLNSGAMVAKYQFHLENLDYFTPFDKGRVTSLWGGWKELTTLIRRNHYFSVKKSKLPPSVLALTSSSLQIAGYTVSFHQEENGIALEDYLESLFPLNREKDTKQFSDLSESDKINTYTCEIMELKGGKDGLNKLGILAMDVDGLGAVMESMETAAEHTKFDGLLRKFFNQRLRKIINNETNTYRKQCNKTMGIQIPKYKNKIYSVTAGGDDSFFVGKWNTILDFAMEVNTAFTKEFPNLTISAGLVVVDPKFPVVRFADLVEGALKRAKYQFSTKGNICLFGEVFRWDMLPEITTMYQLLKKQTLTSGMLAKARVSANNIKDYSALRLDEYWKMGYYLRDVKDKDEIITMIEHYIKEAVRLSKDPLASRNYRKILPVAARLAELDNR